MQNKVVCKSYIWSVFAHIGAVLALKLANLLQLGHHLTETRYVKGDINLFVEMEGNEVLSYCTTGCSSSNERHD